MPKENNGKVEERNFVHPARVVNGAESSVQCCVPHGCYNPEEKISLTNPGQAVKVACNNEACSEGQLMHKQCFDSWEQSVLTYLRSTGRARSWSEKQRLQNLWTKKGYDLAFKACDCKCGRGHLRKDLDYVAPRQAVVGIEQPVAANGGARKKKNKKKKNDRPVIVSSGKATFKTPNLAAAGGTQPLQLRVRTNSVSSTGSSPPNSASPGTPTFNISPIKNQFFCDERVAITGNMFRRRADFSAFRVLPREKQNGYHIKMEDEGPHGNDETRCFILSNLSLCKITSVSCVLCSSSMMVFDRYPLIDGTFFLSPRKYNNSAMQVTMDGRMSYLNAVCMACLEGARMIQCRGCRHIWNGSHLVLGTMYSYDIFAAMPCCQDRLKCNHCIKPIVSVDNPLLFFSEYSRCVACPHCKVLDYHFVKPLDTYVMREQNMGLF